MSSSLRSNADELTLLAIGDVHLGTRPGSLPTELADQGVDLRALTPEAALLTTVEIATEAQVDAVIFAGDVVESTNARFEALRPLESAVRRLLEAGIPVLAVAGNHDVDALPRLARMIEGFELIGEGGRWQTRVIEKAGGWAVEILGWSFPEKRVRSSPVDILLRRPIAPARPGIPRIGVLHGDLDASGGNYAPFTSRELSAAGLDAWLLGHVHKPSLTDGTSADGTGPRGYLGSLVGLDPGEMGPHGPWVVRVNSRGEVAAEQLVIAPLRWERVDVRVAEDELPEDVADRLAAEIARVGREIQAQGSAPRVLGLRPRLVGRTRHYEGLHRSVIDGRWNGMLRPVGEGETLVFIDKVSEELDLAHDLVELARGDDPPALMARKLLLLQCPSEERSALLETTREALQGLVNEPRWSALDEERDQADPVSDPLSDSALAALLARTGTAALAELLSERRERENREAGSGADS